MASARLSRRSERQNTDGQRLLKGRFVYATTEPSPTERYERPPPASIDRHLLPKRKIGQLRTVGTLQTADARSEVGNEGKIGGQARRTVPLTDRRSEWKRADSSFQSI